MILNHNNCYIRQTKVTTWIIIVKLFVIFIFSPYAIFMDIGLKIKALVEQKKVKVPVIAKKLGRSKQNIYAIFKGEQRVSTELLEQISEILDVSPAYFWSELNEDPENYRVGVSDEIMKAYESTQQELISMRRQIELLEKLLEEKDEKYALLKQEFTKLSESKSSD